MSIWLCPLLLVLLQPLLLSLAHIILTFPEARYPPFDLLDSQRLRGPCGVPKSGRSQLSHFQAGQVYSLGWRMAMDGEAELRFKLLDERGQLVPNGVASLNDTELIVRGHEIRSIEARFPTECHLCTLLVEKHGQKLGQNPVEMSCAEVDIQSGQLSASERCSGNGQWHSSGQCQCQHGFSGQYCQNRDDCASNADCGPGGQCIQDGIVPGQKSCFCQFGFFGVNCERRSDPDPADQRCFLHTGPSQNAGADFRYGLFNASCYRSKELNAEDRLHWRLVGNQLELLLDFHTDSWAAIGWRPLQIPTSCRLFPQIQSPETELARTSGFTRDGLEAPLEPMDCVDLVTGSVRHGSFLHIADMYSRDRSSPLRDALLDGEESLSAAYGLQTAQNRTVLMFRRLVPEIEPTDHPLGPGPVFVVFAKGEMGASEGQWQYGGQVLGHLQQLEFVPLSQMSRLRGPLIHLDSSEATSSESSTSTAKTRTTTSWSSTATTGEGHLAQKELNGIGSIWVKTREEEEGKSTTTTTTARSTWRTTTITAESRQNGVDLAENSLELEGQEGKGQSEAREEAKQEQNTSVDEHPNGEHDEQKHEDEIKDGDEPVEGNRVGPRHSGEEKEGAEERWASAGSIGRTTFGHLATILTLCLLLIRL